MVLFAFLVLYNVETVRALTIDECNVLGIVKYQSSDDENDFKGWVNLPSKVWTAYQS